MKTFQLSLLLVLVGAAFAGAHAALAEESVSEGTDSGVPATIPTVRMPSDRFHVRRAQPAALTADESSEIERLGSGMHTLATGRQILKLETGEVIPLPRDNEKGQISKTAVLSENGVLVEPEMLQLVQEMQASSTQLLIEDTARVGGLYSSSMACVSEALDPHSLPFGASQGTTRLNFVLYDRRLDCFIKRMREQHDTIDPLPLIESDLRVHEQRMKLLWDEIENIDVGRLGVTSCEPFSLYDEVTKGLFQSDLYEAAPYIEHRLLLALLASAHLRLDGVEGLVLKVMEAAQQEREQVYGLTSCPALAEVLSGLTLYNRQALLSALVACSPHHESLKQVATSFGAVGAPFSIPPFDAYNCEADAIQRANSGPGATLTIFTSVPDKAFDAVLQEVQSRK